MIVEGQINFPTTTLPKKPYIITHGNGISVHCSITFVYLSPATAWFEAILMKDFFFFMNLNKTVLLMIKSSLS